MAPFNVLKSQYMSQCICVIKYKLASENNIDQVQPVQFMQSDQNQHCSHITYISFLQDSVNLHTFCTSGQADLNLHWEHTAFDASVLILLCCKACESFIFQLSRFCHWKKIVYGDLCFWLSDSFVNKNKCAIFKSGIKCSLLLSGINYSLLLSGIKCSLLLSGNNWSLVWSGINCNLLLNRVSTEVGY